MPNRAIYQFVIGSVLIGSALFIVRLLSMAFTEGTRTPDHPVLALILSLLAAGAGFLMFMPLVRSSVSSSKPTRILMIIMLLGTAFRAMFIGSLPIYEDDWARYLWDGAVVVEGVSPYAHSPADVVAGDISSLSELSGTNDQFAAKINNPDLTTIYPPTAQAVFALVAWVKPFSLDALRVAFLLSEILAMILIVKAMRAFGKPPLGVMLYALNPLVIFAGMNTAHMDILLVPFVMGALILVKKKPILAALSLALAVGVKVWPILLGPVLFRQYRRAFGKYVLFGVVLALASLVLLLPMVVQLSPSSGLSAYSSGWLNSSFLFPILQDGLSLIVDDADRLARILVAIILAGMSLSLGLLSKVGEVDMPKALMILTLALLFLSPTGYPWYAIWLVMFLPFVPLYGVAILSVTVSLYYCRFWFGEAGQYWIYTDILVPIQFGFPLLILAVEAWCGRRSLA